jgi:hypothetical protein
MWPILLCPFHYCSVVSCAVFCSSVAGYLVCCDLLYHYWHRVKTNLQSSNNKKEQLCFLLVRVDGLYAGRSLVHKEPVLSPERVPHKDRAVTVKQNLISGHEPKMGLDTITDWLTDRQSQCDFDLCTRKRFRVEAGSITSTVVLRVVGGDEKGTQCLGV